ncbi:MAG: AMP-binding protein [Methylococcales bacterium]|nr:AMP-binding protein [Methylococcales bacterium]
MSWWRKEALLRRFIVDFMLAGVARLRPGAVLPSQDQLVIQGDWRAGLLYLDSLELLDVATAFAQCLGIDKTGLGDALLAKPTLQGWVAVAQNSLEMAHADYQFYSSGSTHQAHPHRLPHAHLQAEATWIAEALLIMPPKRIWSLVPAHHVYGFIFTILVPTALNTTPTVFDARKRLPSVLQALLEPGDMVVGIPDFWRVWMASGLQLPMHSIAITSGAPCEAALWTALCAQTAQAIDVYGTTESAGIAIRTGAEQGFTLMPHWRRLAHDHLVSSHHQAVLPDVLDWLDDRQFHVHGRKDGVIQVAGHNVDLSAIARCLERYPGVSQAVVRPQGQGLKAFVVLQAEVASDADVTVTLKQWLSQQLPAYQIPKYINIGAELPRNAMGKLTDWAVA